MMLSEFDSFTNKFKLLWLSGKEADLQINSKNGKLWISLSLGLQCPPYTPPSSPAQHPPPRPRSSRNTPSQQRRRTRRKAEREASLAAANCIEKTNAENISAAKIIAAEATTEIATTIDMTVQVDESDQIMLMMPTPQT